MEIYNMIKQRIKKEERKYELIKSKLQRDRTFGDLISYVKYIFEYLWKNPYYVSKILLIADNNDIKNCLAHFFTVNFYDNNLSNNNKEGQLLFVIALLVKEEINKFNFNKPNNDINIIEQIFLNNTPCSYIFSELFYKKEIQSFFKPIIIDIIEELESSFPSQKIIFDPGLIRDSILFEKREQTKEKEEDIIQNREKIITIRKSIYKNDKDINEKLKLFNEKYQFGLQREQLLKISKECEDKRVINYMYKNILDSANNPDIYSTSVFLEKIHFIKMSNDIGENYDDDERKQFSKNILAIYQQSFLETTKIIDKLLDYLISNIHLLPFTIKCINKIIFSIIDKKFPNLFAHEKYFFIYQFFFNKLVFPMLLEPSIYSLINDFIISDNTRCNISIIMGIINKFSSGQFYKDTQIEGQFTPFNWYFLLKIPKLLEFFEKASNVDLPDYIQKIFDDDNNNELDSEYNYFEENYEEMISTKNILFSFDDFYYLYMNMEANKDKLFDDKNEKTKVLKKAIIRLRESEYKIDKIKNSLEKTEEKTIRSNISPHTKKNKQIDKKEDEENKLKSLKFFLISELLFNKKCENLFNINSTKEYYNIKEEKNQEINDKAIIKAKNFICSFLYNYYSLEDIHLSFKNEKESNSINILKKLKNYTKSSDLLRNEKIPYEWYIDSIIEYLKKLPPKYSENDYNLLYDELEQEIKDSIKIYNFEEISLLANKIKFLKNSHIYYDEAKKVLIDIDLNNRVQVILEKEKIPMEVRFTYTSKKKRFKIMPLSSTISGIFLPLKLFTNSEHKTCQTINQFISIFPDLNELKKDQDSNIFDIIKELQIPEKLDEYFDYIEKYLKETEIENINEIKDIKIKIYDYVMEKLYDKLFPDDSDNDDIIIYNNCCKASWVELKHFIKGKDDYILENFIPDTNHYFQQINKEKSPRKKLIYMNKIFTCIQNLGLLNGDHFEGTDEILSILNYAFIKNKPVSIYSNCKYMNLFIGEKKNKGEGHQLSQMIGICQQVLNFNYKCLFDITEEEYNKNCDSINIEEI